MFKYRKHVSRAGNRLIGGLEELCGGVGQGGDNGDPGVETGPDPTCFSVSPELVPVPRPGRWFHVQL